MYNRYVPQSDGSFRRNRMPESGNSQTHPSYPQRKPQHTGPTAPVLPCPPAPAPERRNTPQPKPRSAEGFLRQLLPQGLDTGDLLIAVLLLLMAGDCQDDKNTALLTLALYLFM